METHTNPQEQQRMAKLNLLVLDDDYERRQQDVDLEEYQQWGRSVQTQIFFRQKLSQRYKLKRKSQYQSAIKANFLENLNKKPMISSDKQSLKEILRKLDSKEVSTPKQQTMRNSMISENDRFSRQKEMRKKHHSYRTTIDYQQGEDRPIKVPLKESSSKGENNFISKKMDIISGKKIKKLQDESFLSIESPFGQNNADPMLRKREYFTECKHSRRFKNRIRKNMENNNNKENEAIELMENPLELFKSGDKAKKSGMGNREQKGGNNLMEREEINKRTFHILQEINRSKNINLGNKTGYDIMGNKTGYESLKMKKSGMVPYSKVLGEKSKCMSRQKRQPNLLMKTNHNNLWVKLQIRG